VQVKKTDEYKKRVMSIVMTHDTDNGNRCIVYSEKEYLNHEYDKKPEQCVLFRTSPITVHAYMYLIATERSHMHKVIGAVLCF